MKSGSALCVWHLSMPTIISRTAATETTTTKNNYSSNRSYNICLNTNNKTTPKTSLKVKRGPKITNPLLVKDSQCTCFQSNTTYDL